jgi:hypothetical protein
MKLHIYFIQQSYSHIAISLAIKEMEQEQLKSKANQLTLDSVIAISQTIYS